MGILKKIFGAPTVAAEGVAGAATKAAEGVSKIVERWIPSEAAKQEAFIAINTQINAAIAEARKYDPRTVGQSLFSEIVNVTVDAVARMIRPLVTVMLIGGVFGWWELQTQSIDPLVLGWAEVVVGFWFGYRTIVRDVPSLIKALREARSE